MATKKKPAPKAAPKAVAKAPAKPAAKAVAKKPVAKAPAKPAAKPAAKPVAKKPAAKAPAKPVAKAPAKPVAKPAAKKPAAKAPAKPAPKAAAKPAAKPASKVAAKAPAKPAAKVVAKAPAKPAAKPVAKAPAKPVSKPEPKVAAKPAPVAKPVAKPASKSGSKKSAPSKTIITSTSVAFPKKSDVFKTNTFGASNLKNENGKVIAHRKTADMKRRPNDTSDIKKYQPEQTRSILDNAPVSTNLSYRYSDEDLNEFRDLIMRKLETAKAELHYLQGVIMRKDEGGTEDTENKYQNIEDGSASMDREQYNQMASRQINFISHLEQALMRIENKTYGICRVTGKLIDKARLRAVPHATLSMEAKSASKN